MPSFLARFLGLSFRTERLIMNIIGLINSTLDWSPLKWTNELEQIQNISLSYSTLILSTIGEDTIKTVLSWIVITRIIIAHVYTFTYLTNIYPIITWSRPCLLLPWLILSFFKNVVLEVIVLAVCLLYWYDKRFSLAIFLEFILVKLVPLILASYNWYSNSRLFLELQYAEKIKKLKRTLKSDTNFVTNRLYMKIADSKYRTRSLTTLLSYESYETFDSQDTISRILDDNDLTPAEKTMRILGITDQDIIDARAGKKEREDHRRLTEVDDELFKARRFVLNKFYMLTKDYEDQESFFRPNNEELVEDSLVIEEIPLPSEAPKETMVETLSEVTENPTERPKLNNPKNVDEPKLNNPGKIATPKLDNPIKVDATEPFSNEKKEEINNLQKNETKQNEKCSFSSKDVEVNSSSTQKRNCPRLDNSKPEKKDVENDCNLIKFQSLFNCDCSIDNNVFKDGKEHCCLPNKFILKTSTPNESPDTGRKTENLESDDIKNENDGASMMENLFPNSNETILKEELKEEVQVPNENLLVNYVKILEHENLKQQVRQITDNIKILLSNFKEDAYLKGSYIGEKSVERSMDQNRCGLDQNVSIGVQNLSEVVKDMRTANPMENFEMLKSNSYKPEVKENRLRVNVPEYSFGDTNIPRFYKDSMKVFDGCYEQDFANNSELQCVLQQLEKKKWNPFAGQSNLETLLQQDDEINHSTVRALRNVSPPVKDCEKTDRFKSTVHVSSENAFHSENLMSQKTQVTERSLDNIPRKLRKISPTIPTKNSHTQTDSVHSSSKISIIADLKSRKKVVSKRKLLKDQSNVSSVNDHQDNKIKTRCSPNSQSEKVIKQSNLSKSSLSSSDKSVCECKMQQLEAKCSPSSESRKEDRRKSTSRPKVDTFDTVNLAQVARSSNFNGSANKRKPPVYPKKIKKELSSNILPKITPMIKKLQEPKRPKTKSRLESSNDKEMRALKAYNEVTLVMDKKQLDAKRKVPSSKITLDVLPEESKHRLHPRKSNSKRKLSLDKKLISEEYLDKENLSVGVSVDLESSVATSSKAINEGGKVLQLSNKVYTCSKLQQGYTKVNRVTDKILDRLFSIENQRKSSVETDTRKQLSKYSKPKQMIDEDVVSASSSKKLEGMQNGRELERTQAKEDIRDEFKNLTNSSRVQPLIESGEGCTTIPFTGTKDSRKQQDNLLLTIKSGVNQDVMSKWSSSTIDQLEETQLEAERDDLPVMNQPQIILNPEDPTEEPKVQEEASPLKQNEIESVPEEISSNTSDLQSDDGTSRTTNYTDFTRNIDVSYLVHGVVLSNQNAPKSKNPRQRDIVDDTTSRLLHTAFSYQSMDSVLDFATDTINVNNIMNERHLDPLDDGFVQLSNDVVDAFPDELPLIPHDHDNLEEAIPAILRESQDLDEQAENCNLFIATVDEEHSNNVFSILGQLLSLNTGNLSLENADDPGLGVLQGLLRENDGEESRQVTEENDTIEEENDEGLEDDQTLRFIKEDVFTDIKFPIVINWSDSLIASNEDHEELNPVIRDRDVGIRSTGLLCLNGPEEEKKLKDVKLESEETKNVEQSIFFAKLEYSSGSAELKHEESEKKIGEDFGKSKSISSDEAAYRMYRTIKYFESEETASETESEENTKFEEETIVSEKEAMPGNVEEIIKGFQLFNINDTILMEESMELEEIELPDRAAQPIDFKDEEDKIILIEKIEELEDTEESNEVENMTVIQDSQDDEEKEITVLERISPLTILLVWMIVSFLYVQFWWRKICSTQISRSTSTLNPFDIHAAPISTTTLFEKIEEKEKEDEDDSENEIANFQAEADFRIKEQYSSNIIEFTNDPEEIEKEVEEAMLSLSEHISKNVEIPSFLNSDEEKTQSNLSSIASATRDVETSNQIIFRTTDERLRDLRAAEEEIKTFRFEEVDDCSSTKSLPEENEETKLSVDNQLNYPATEGKIDEDGPDKEAVPENDKKKEQGKNDEDTTILKNETIVEEVVEEAESSTEKAPATTVFEPNFQNTDSFDSTYSKISDTSKRTISDLHASSMEEFEDTLDS